MKRVLTLAIIILLISCKHDVTEEVSEINISNPFEHEIIEESFEEISFETLNKTLEGNNNLSPKDIIKLHYAHVELGEGNEKIVITEDTLVNGNILVTLTHENLPDDAVKAEKRVMELKKKSGYWEIVSLKRNWICWRNNSQNNWGINRCN